MADRIYDITKQFKIAAEIGQKFILFTNHFNYKIYFFFNYYLTKGCHRGFIAKHDLSDSVEEMYLCDSSPTLLEQAKGREGLKITKLEMDEEMPNVSQNHSVYGPLKT